MYTQRQAFNKVEEIINDIIEGRRLHVQEVYHAEILREDDTCGTAHCIAGWAIIDYAKDNNLSTETDDIYGRGTDYSESSDVTYISKDLVEESEILEYIANSFGERKEAFETQYEELSGEESFEWSVLEIFMKIEHEEAKGLFGPELNIFEIRRNFNNLKELYDM